MCIHAVQEMVSSHRTSIFRKKQHFFVYSEYYGISVDSTQNYGTKDHHIRYEGLFVV